MISQENLSDLFTEARNEFSKEKYNSTVSRNCQACGACVHASAQSWNDVGGEYPGYCEACWVESWVCFQVGEMEATWGEDANAPGVCSYCGGEVRMFEHDPCPKKVSDEASEPVFGTKMHESLEAMTKLSIQPDDPYTNPPELKLNPDGSIALCPCGSGAPWGRCNA